MVFQLCDKKFSIAVEILTMVCFICKTQATQVLNSSVFCQNFRKATNLFTFRAPGGVRFFGLLPNLTFSARLVQPLGMLLAYTYMSLTDHLDIIINLDTLI